MKRNKSKSKQSNRSKNCKTILNGDRYTPNFTFSGKFSTVEPNISKSNKDVNSKKKKNRIFKRSITDHSGNHNVNLSDNFTIEEKELFAYSGYFKEPNLKPKSTKNYKNQKENNLIPYISKHKSKDEKGFLKMSFAVSNQYRQNKSGKGI